jgi:hypothetical protein
MTAAPPERGAERITEEECIAMRGHWVECAGEMVCVTEHEYPKRWWRDQCRRKGREAHPAPQPTEGASSP